MTDIELLKRQIEDQLLHYEAAIKGYAAFMDDWKSRNSPEGKRLQRFRAAKQREPSP